MTSHRSVEKWGPIVLGVVCVFTVIKLVRELQGSPRPVVQADSRSDRPTQSRPKNHDRSDGFWESGTLQLAQLKTGADRPLPTIERNPFGYPPPPTLPNAGDGTGSGNASLPPPPPPIPLKALGYSQAENGIFQAYLTGQGQVYVVRVGDEVSHRYKILAITPLAVEIKDLQSGEQARLPIPRPQ